MIIVAVWDKVFKSSYFTFAENLNEFNQKQNSDWHLWYEVATTQEVPESAIKNLRLIIATSPKEALDNIAAAFSFGFLCGQEEERVKLDEAKRKGSYR